MHRKILNRWTGAVLWSGDAETVKDALHAAIASGSNLRGSNLSGSDLRDSNLRDSDLRDSNLRGSDLSGSNLSGSNLRDSNLRGSDLSGSNLSGSNLRGSDLSGSNLSGSDLRGSNLSGSNLSGSNLRGSDLSGSNLSGSNLRGSNLRGSDLSGSNLMVVRDDVWAVLASAPAEVEGLLRAIESGQIDGSTYQGQCACLVGTIAKVRGCHYDEVEGLTPQSSRPAEVFFAAIAPGQTPENHEPSRIAAEWVRDYLTRHRAAFAQASA